METITISDWDAGNFLCTTISDPNVTNVTYSVPEYVTSTNI